MVTKAMLVELGPVLTAFMVTGRVGAAMCAELGTMRVTEQIDALSVHGCKPSSLSGCTPFYCRDLHASPSHCFQLHHGNHRRIYR